MRQYKFARVFITLDAINKKEAIEKLKKKYPNENIELQIESKKIVIAKSVILTNNIKRNKPVQGLVYCSNCNHMHREGSKQHKHCQRKIDLMEFEKDLIDNE